MKKISYILGILGVISIVISILLLNNKDVLPWNVEYQKSGNISKNFKEYNVSSLEKININDGKYFYYYIPQDAYLIRVDNDDIGYQNDNVTISFSKNIIEDKEIEDELSHYDNSLEILKYELENGNILVLHKMMNDTNYSENLFVFVKVIDNLYYKINYYIENMNFSNAFIKEISDIPSFQYKNSNIENITDEWKINNKTFKLNYDSSKYIKGKIYRDYEMYLKLDNDSNEMIKVNFNYNKNEIGESIFTLYTVKNSEKIKLKNYDSVLYTLVDKSNIEYTCYDIMIDKNTKMIVNYPKSLNNNVDINDFLSFTYK